MQNQEPMPHEVKSSPVAYDVVTQVKGKDAIIIVFDGRIISNSILLSRKNARAVIDLLQQALAEAEQMAGGIITPKVVN